MAPPGATRWQSVRLPSILSPPFQRKLLSTLTLEAILNPAPVEPTRTITATENPGLQFTDFKISDSLKQRLTKAGFSKPTPVQAGAIPPALEGEDILATASTGTGKTLSFLIPMIERLEDISDPSTKANKTPILALILLPTRELARGCRCWTSTTSFART
jgi:ATP-dependent RNA helicase RhlE